MGSSCLIAAAMVKPVGDAVTEVTIPEAGTYRLWAHVETVEQLEDVHGVKADFPSIVAGRRGLQLGVIEPATSGSGTIASLRSGGDSVRVSITTGAPGMSPT